MQKNYRTILNIADYSFAENYIKESSYLSFDTETTGLNVLSDKVIGFSFSNKAGDGIYFPIETWDSDNECLKEIWSIDSAKNLLNLINQKELVMWNASFDIRMVKNNFDINMINSLLMDAMLAKHTVDEEGKFGLKTVAIQYAEELGFDITEEANKEQIELKANVSKNGGSTTKTNYEMYKADLDVMAKYASADADLTIRLAELFAKKLVEENLESFFYDDEVMPLLKKVTINMESNGVKLDVNSIRTARDSISQDIDKLHDTILSELLANDDAYKWLCFTSNDKHAPKKTGKFGQMVVKLFNLDLPISEKTGKYSMGKKLLEALPDSPAKNFLLGDFGALDERTLYGISVQLWEESNGAKINISSKKQMAEIVFDYMGIKPLSKTDKGTAQFNDDMVQHLAEKGFNWAMLLGDYNKLIKIRSAYMDRFLDNMIDDHYYFYYKQHGTISGRFSSDAQQLPRPKEDGELSPLVLKYNNIIRKFFISGSDRKFIDCDYESLEPHVFSHVSNDEGLRNIFRKGHDFYSTIAIGTEKLEGVSADKKADNYLGKLNKPLRQKAKAYSLGVPYGLSPFALSKTLDVTQEEAQELYDGYLDGFPDLKSWMKDSNNQAQFKGYVETQTGRRRHLNRVKELHAKHKDKLLDFKYRNKLVKKLSAKMDAKEAKDKVQNAYRDYKNGLNNSKNFQIQGLSASIVNRAMIKIAEYFDANNIDAWVCGTVHDQIIVNAPESMAQELSLVVEDIMCNTVKLSVELKAPPCVAANWYDSH